MCNVLLSKSSIGTRTVAPLQKMKLFVRYFIKLKIPKRLIVDDSSNVI